MENKIHYKLHKVKKQWVTIAVASVALATVLGGLSVTTSSVSADETQDKTVTQSNSGTTASLVTSPEATKEADKRTNSKEADVLTPAKETNAVETATTTNTQATAEAATTATTADVAVAAVPNKEAVVTTDAPAVTTEKAEEQPATVKAEVVNTEVKAPEAALKDSEVEAALSLKNIKNIDGKYYYVNEDGSHKENFAITVNGQLLYFGKDGALTSSSTYSFTPGTTNIVDGFSINNRAYDSSEASFELIDGYLTADSWYRPASIIKDGVTWQASTAEDFRPLLMAWWPNVDTQVNYLNYMSKVFNLDAKYSSTDKQETLKVAAKDIQIKIEQKIQAEKSTQWLRETISAFVKTQPQWNKETENYSKGGGEDHLQGGALLYVNDSRTPWANSDYRRLNRTATNQTGTIDKSILDEQSDPNHMGGFDFLLANDVDLSNPVVQAEQLNQIHYLMNWGSIVMGDKDANFDGIRVDAVDNVDADMLQLYTNYFREYYGVNKSEANALAHISVLEAWSLNDNHYNDKTDGAALAMENKQRLALLFSLAKPIKERTPAVSPLYNNTFNTTQRDEKTDWINKDGSKAYNEDGTVKQSTIGKYNEKYGDASGNYVFIRAHDNNVQDIIAEIIKKEINPKSDGFTITDAEMKQAFEIYNKDMLSSDKKYTLNNIPAAYAVMLQNMETITRVYYGDLYTDDGHYMETKSPYYDTIVNLMKSRIKYVSGGQAQRSYWLPTDGKMDNSDVELYRTNEVYTSVRYGKDIMTANDTEGSKYSRTSGQVTLVANNPKLNLDQSAKLNVEMGKIHANQKYRALIVGTADGIKNFTSDADAIAAGYVKETDSNGVLTFGANDIKGYETFDMSGFVAVWVPVGASDDQDIRVAPSTEAKKEGELTLKATEAYDSQLIYEGFSNFQTIPDGSDPSVYTNRKIAENVDLFKSWGVTSFEMAPQFVSADDGTFLDSVIQNGYAFADRYDLAMSKNNKYGSKEDLRDALKALHKAGIQAIADWVPDQIYQLPGKEVVTATRTDGAGRKIADAIIDHSLYVANSKSSGKDYQAKYGGEFLAELKAKYPEMFKVNMISTGKPIDDSVKLKQWKAEYFNGTNVLERGVGYVLSDEATGKYFTVTKEGNFIPLQLTGNEKVVTGFSNDGKGITYFGTSGTQAKSAFVTFNGNTYYFDARGHMVTNGEYSPNGKDVYRFLPNGIMLSNAFYVDANGNTYLYNSKGQMYKGGYTKFDVTETDKDGKESKVVKFRYFTNEGVMAKGVTVIDGFTQYFGEDGFQAKDKLVTFKGKTYYFDAHTGNAIKNTWRNIDGKWYHFDANGVAATGAQVINGQKLYFNEDGSQVKGGVVKNADGTYSKYKEGSGELVTNEFFTTDGNVWYYAGANGKTVTGAQVINGQHLYFNADGSQVKGGVVKNADGTYSKYDAATGERLTNEFFTTGDNNWYYIGANGKTVTGEVKIGDDTYYFAKDGKQVKGQTVSAGNGRISYYYGDSGKRAVSTWVEIQPGVYVYFDKNGLAYPPRVLN